MNALGGNFSENVRTAVADPQLQRAMAHVKSGFIGKRAKAAARLPEFEALRDAARGIKDHTLAHLDLYLERYEARVTANGGHVHWCATPAEARAAILDICRQAGARTVTKGKSMIGEEIDINAHLEAHGIVPVETDLGEYIVQMRHERPSHIIAPAVHLTKDAIEADFRAHHRDLPADRQLSEVPQLVDEARQILRQRFLDADVGITGANFLVAETGSSIIVTNEGNGDLTQTLPRVHIVIASLEKMVPTLEDAMTILRVLARSATGQEFSTYTTVSTGARRPGDMDGPEAYHVVLLDNGRSELLDGPFREVLRCIRCGACMNHCPVYHAIGGHAYGSVYPGPIGAVLTPALVGIEAAADLPEASTFCGRCESVCPMRIPLPNLLRHWRERAFEKKVTPRPLRAGIGLWAFLARRPALYALATGVAAPVLAWLGRRRGRFSRLPLAGGWTRFRDLPAPQGRTFRDQWAARR
jgi:L-lactate dehydrogenase complex protein LldF